MSVEGRTLTLESDVDDGVILGLGIFINLHKLFCDKTVLSVCVDAGLHKVLVRYTNPVLVVDAVDECLSKMSVVEERLEWEIIFRSSRMSEPARQNLSPTWKYYLGTVVRAVRA